MNLILEIAGKTSIILMGVLTLSVAAARPAVAVPLAPVAAKPVAPSPEARPETAAPQRAKVVAGAIPSSAVTPPRVIRSFPPQYTIQGWAALVEGTVTLQAAVDSRGNARILRVVKGLGYGLDEKAAEAVRGWKFAPALRNGIPVDTMTQIEVDFDVAHGPRPLRLQDTAGMAVTPPVLIHRVDPQYPEEARKESRQGTVLLEVIVRRDGACEVLRVLTSRGSTLDESATEAVSQWRFEPGMRKGQPIDLALNVAVNFTPEAQTGRSQIRFEQP